MTTTSSLLWNVDGENLLALSDTISNCMEDSICINMDTAQVHRQEAWREEGLHQEQATHQQKPNLIQDCLDSTNMETLANRKNTSTKNFFAKT
jgi:hypothetical protein